MKKTPYQSAPCRTTARSRSADAVGAVVPAAESINSLYLSITGRRADSGGLNYWYSDYMNACESSANCDTASAATIVSPEALNQVSNAIQFSYDNGEGTYGGLVGEFTYCEAKAMGY